MINQNILYTIIILIIGILIFCRNKNEYEYFDTQVVSNEAIQNIASIYNTSNMSLTNLNVTGNLTLGNWILNDSSDNLMIKNKTTNNTITISATGTITPSNNILNINGNITASGNIDASGDIKGNNISSSKYSLKSGWEISSDLANNLSFKNTLDSSSNGPLLIGRNLDRIISPAPNFGIYSGSQNKYNRFLFTADGFLIAQLLDSDKNIAKGIASYTVNNKNPFIDSSFMKYTQ